MQLTTYNDLSSMPPLFSPFGNFLIVPSPVLLFWVSLVVLFAVLSLDGVVIVVDGVVESVVVLLAVGLVLFSAAL